MTDPTAPIDRPDVPGHRLLRVIGHGSSAIVWSAADPSGRPVAIKVPHTAPDAVEVRQGEIERQVLTAVRHEHLVPLRDVVPLVDGRVALVFDLVVGATLRSMVQVRGHLRPGEAVTLMTPLAEAVAVLHAAGGTHCDISASNVMVTADGRPMLMDLGSARLAGTGAGATVGTPGFVAPEVREGDPPTEASDVFALGALAWFCLTGNGAPDTVLRLSPETVLSHVGEELAEVIGACIDPEPQRRPASSVLAARFYDAVAAEPIEVVVGADDASALTHRLRAEASRGGTRPAPRRPTRRWLPSARRKERGAERHLTPARGRPDDTGQALERPWFRVPKLRGRRWPRRAGTAAVIALLALFIGGLAHLGALPWTGSGPVAVTDSRPGPPADPVTVDVPSRPATASSGGTTTAAAPASAQAAPVTQPPELLRSRAAVMEQPRAVIQALTDLRVQALTTRDANRLVAVHVKQSPSFDLDAGVIDELLTGGQRYEGLKMAVDSASHLSGGPTRAVIRARVDVAAYVVVSDDGAPTEEPAIRGEVLDFTLVWQPDGWRLESVSEPAST